VKYQEVYSVGINVPIFLVLLLIALVFVFYFVYRYSESREISDEKSKVVLAIYGVICIGILLTMVAIYDFTKQYVKRKYDKRCTG
jgi:uncharacterized membrane protein YjfL (UPF0719 family)